MAALASFLAARSAEGTWLVRIDDVDATRTVPGATRHILRDLERLGLHWDETVVYQSTRSQHYDSALSSLRTNQNTFPCGCSRKELHGQIYSGTCRHGLPPGKTARSIRLRCEVGCICVHDMIQGPFTQDLKSAVGDFVVKRGDGMHAYHLATVVDDALQDITDIVRGADLLDSTPRQMLLQRHLAFPLPRYAHLPIALNAQGQKLSKQTGAQPIDTRRPTQMLFGCLQFLGQHPPSDAADARPEELLQWAIKNWSLSKVPAGAR